MTIMGTGNVGIGTTAPTAYLTIKAGTATASTAPFKLTTGVSNTTAELGTIEFTDPDIFFTITDTTVKRKAFVLDDGTRLTATKVPVASTNGRLIDSSFYSDGADNWWVGDGTGLPYGEMYANNVTQAVVITTVDVHVEVDGGFTGGELNLVTFPDDHYLLVTKAGRYRVDYSISASSDVQGKEIEAGIMIGGVTQTKGTSHAESGIGGGGKPNVLAGHAIFDLAVNDQISLCLANHTDDTDLQMNHANMTVQMVGGT